MVMLHKLGPRSMQRRLKDRAMQHFRFRLAVLTIPFPAPSNKSVSDLANYIFSNGAYAGRVALRRN